MSSKFYSYNLAWQDATTITGSNENSFFPFSNLKDYRRTKTGNSTGTSTEIVFDFSSAEDFDTVIIVDNPQNGFGFNTPVTIEANATDVWTSPSFSTTITSSDLDATHGFAFKSFASQTYRFVRLSFSATTTVEVANVFIGEEISMADNGFDFNWTYVDNELGSVSTNRYGQRFVDKVVRQKNIRGNISYMNLTEMDQILQLNDVNGVDVPIFFRFEDSGTNILNDVDRFGGMYYLRSAPTFTNASVSLYNVTLDFVEAM